MPYRMGSGFEHGQIADLNRDDKDLFARRWVDVTEQHHSAQEKASRAQELLQALHSNDRVERLTGNPMLLTTLALVKRKVGKLPNKRTKLYAEAVSVLLNWNPRLYQTIEEDEAIPQLEYLAYEMCRRGVQRLADDDVLDLLERLRTDYPNIRAVKRSDPRQFLALLEARSSILIKSGRHPGKKCFPRKVGMGISASHLSRVPRGACSPGRSVSRARQGKIARGAGCAIGRNGEAHASTRIASGTGSPRVLARGNAAPRSRLQG